MDYTKLQNGSDIRGVALEGIVGQTVNLTEEVCRNIGRGFALWLMNKVEKRPLRVAVGRDSRLSGPALGRPKKGESRNKLQDYKDECERVEVERKFSLAKGPSGRGFSALARS